MKTMKPFDLNSALDGAKLVTTNGNPARLICVDRQNSKRFVWLEQDEKSTEYLASGDYEHLSQVLRLADDESVEQARAPLPHAELIHAWADGAEVQMLSNGEWKDTKTPLWSDDQKYRIKPNEPHWYENIPEHGRLCWVKASSVEPLHPTIAVIVRYDSAVTAKYQALSGVSWCYATPLTNDEIKQFLD